MDIVKHCPNCGFELESDEEFCPDCGYDLKKGIKPNFEIENKSFFENLKEKTSFPVIVFSFVIFGIFLFVGSVFWSSFMANGSIDLITYLLLTVVFSVLFAAIFVGYFGCNDKSDVVPNFSVYLGSVFAVVLCGIGLIFSLAMGILSALSSAFSAMGSNSMYGSPYQQTSIPSIDLSGFFKIILFILLIPVASYLGVFLGYYLKQNI